MSKVILLRLPLLVGLRLRRELKKEVFSPCLWREKHTGYALFHSDVSGRSVRQELLLLLYRHPRIKRKLKMLYVITCHPSQQYYGMVYGIHVSPLMNSAEALYVSLIGIRTLEVTVGPE